MKMMALEEAKEYTCLLYTSTYYNAALSSSITINGYRKVISGTHTKAGWWTAASGGTYVNVDGAAL